MTPPASAPPLAGLAADSDTAPILVVYEHRQYIPDLMATAARLSGDGRRHIHLLVTIPVPSTAAVDATLPEDEERADTLIEEARVSGGRRASGRWVKVRPGGAGHAILAEARRLGVRAIVMPAGRTGAAALNDAAVETVLRDRPCRVFVEAIPDGTLPDEVREPARRTPASASASGEIGGPSPAGGAAEARRSAPDGDGSSVSGASLRPWERVEVAEYSPAEEGAGENRDVALHGARAVLALGALGVVYGDIGTSPLYTEQTIFGFHAAAKIGPTSVYGITSLIFWAMTLVVSIKYAGVIMRVHNRGDGGIMALATLARRYKVPRNALLVTLGVFGASLFFGDGVITPAISVLSAVSGLEVVSPGLSHAVVPISVVILLLLFMFQRKGTGSVGTLFGPIMLVYFTVIGGMGLLEVSGHPGVLQALSPTWGIRFFVDHGFEAFLTLGGVVLCVTGAEALYADRGHFGPAPIRLSWYLVVFPSVLLSYLGQSAGVMIHHANRLNPFFLLFPHWFQIPLVILSTVATIIASQAVISGSYTVARQAMQLGFLPRLRVVHTSKLEGQIYVPVINWLLAAGVLLVVLAFQNANRLANAYGVAVTGTFVLNTVLFLVVFKAHWRPARWRLWLMGTVFLTVEVAFLLANLAKLLHGAWLPLAAGFAISALMLVWNRGAKIVSANRIVKEGPLGPFLEEIESGDRTVVRTPGVGIFLVPDIDSTPLALRAAIQHTGSLSERLLLVSVQDANVPSVDDDRRYVVGRIGSKWLNMRHVRIRVGYQERVDVPGALAAARRDLLLERDLDLENASYFISRITISADDHSQLRRWQQRLFMAMARNSATLIDRYGLPDDRTVSIGSSVYV